MTQSQGTAQKNIKTPEQKQKLDNLQVILDGANAELADFYQEKGTDKQALADASDWIKAQQEKILSLHKKLAETHAEEGLQKAFPADKPRGGFVSPQP